MEGDRYTQLSNLAVKVFLRNLYIHRIRVDTVLNADIQDRGGDNLPNNYSNLFPVLFNRALQIGNHALSPLTLVYNRIAILITNKSALFSPLIHIPIVTNVFTRGL